MTDMDAYYQAFDIHGEDMECSQCGCQLDSLYVTHWGSSIGVNGQEEAVPICDRCWYEECARDAERDDDFEVYD